MSTITAVLHRHLAFVSMLLLATIASHLPSTHSFAIPTPRNNGHSMVPSLGNTINTPRMNDIHTNNIFSTKLHAEDQDSNDGDGSVNPSPSSPPLGQSEAAILGVAGVIASNIMFYSESVLFRTGHGLPGGGLVGVVEGFSYLFEVGLAGFSVYTMISTVSEH